jgi:hypothetical protein
MVRLMRRSKASPDAAWVICASVSAGGDAMSSTLETTKTGLSQLISIVTLSRGKTTHSSKTLCQSR